MISIITVCHRSGELLRDYVGTFLGTHADRPGEGVEFILVENSGDPRTEGHAARLREAGFAAQVVETENRGFGAGCNAGAARASGEVLVFANPDIRFLADLRPIEATFSPRGWGTVRQIDGRGGVYAFDLLPEYQSFATELLRIRRHCHRWPALRRVSYPVGSLFVVAREPYRESGGFDERFFLYFEEAELSRRLHALAGPPIYHEGASISHKAQGTQPSLDFAFREEVRGFMTYVSVTGQPGLKRRRARMLRALSFLSPRARQRASLLQEALLSERQA